MNQADVVKDWPADPANEELSRLAEELHDAVPALPPAALARVQQQLLAELDRAQRRQRGRRWAFGLSIAATILLALGGYWYFRPASSTPQSAKNVEPPEIVLIEDR